MDSYKGTRLDMRAAIGHAHLRSAWSAEWLPNSTANGHVQSTVAASSACVQNEKQQRTEGGAFANFAVVAPHETFVADWRLCTPAPHAFTNWSS